MRKKGLFLVMLLVPLMLLAKSPVNKGPKPEPQKTVQAVRVNGPISIDGLLNEDVWQREGYSDFTMTDPNDGEQPTEKTEVWIAYDEKALYVAARLYDSEPELIRCRLGRRDDFVDSDWFIFAVDTYYDRRSGYQFAVNP
ncbi:MAG: carbohydrate binding family 9 domain-containing protein, partial [Candidatus Aminicenantes bacterium]